MILDESKVECVELHAGSGHARNRIIYIKKNIHRSSDVDSGLLTSWGMVGDLKAPTRFVENCAGRNSIGRPLRACIECIVVHKKKLAGPAWCRGDLSW